MEEIGQKFFTVPPEITGKDREIFTKKNNIQKFALTKWKENGYKGIMTLATGVGKTKIGVFAAIRFIEHQQLNLKNLTYPPNKMVQERSLIIVPKIPLRDEVWPNEIKKWGYEKYMDFVDIECIQSAYKFDGQHYNTLILDECHNYAGNEFMNLLSNNKFNRILALSASLTQKQIDSFKKYNINHIFSYTLEDAQKAGLVPDSVDCYLPISTLKSEEDKIQYLHRQIRSKEEYIQSLDTNLQSLYSIVKKDPTYELPNMSRRETEDFVGSCFGISSAKIKCLSCIENKIKACATILELCHKLNKKVIVFSESVDSLLQVELLLISLNIPYNIYHSKLTPSRKEKQLQNFSNGESNILLSAKGLNEGYDLPILDVAIELSFTDLVKDRIQRRGRVLRYVQGKTPIYVNIVQGEGIINSELFSEYRNLLNLNEKLGIKNPPLKLTSSNIVHIFQNPQNYVQRTHQ